MGFKNKVIWITGASSGIGEALTYSLSRQGAKLIISSRRKEALEEVKSNCEGKEEHIFVLPLDLSKPDSIPAIAQKAMQKYGPIDLLFNNGGISQRSEAINTRMDVVRKVMEVNFFGTVAITGEVLPSMVERGEGNIIVTSSVMGKFGTRLRSSYAASKHALHGYFDSLRQEVHDDNVKITLVCPGFIKTNVTKNALQGDGSAHGKMGKGQEQGMEADEFVKKLLPRIEKGQEEIYIGGKEIWGVYFKRLAPRLFYKILRKANVT